MLPNENPGVPLKEYVRLVYKEWDEKKLRPPPKGYESWEAYRQNNLRPRKS